MTSLLSHHHRTVLWGALTLCSHLALLKMMPLSAWGFVARSCAEIDLVAEIELRVGPGNRIVNALSYGNADDGYDLFNKVEDGPNGAVVIENSVAMFNNNNGFKLGGEGLPVAHEISGSISYKSGMDGFTDNFNPGQLKVLDNVSIDNARFNFLFRKGPYIKDASEQGTFEHNVSLRTKEGRYSDVVNGNIADNNVFMADTKPNSNELGYTIHNYERQPKAQDNQVPERKADGSLDRSFFYTNK